LASLANFGIHAPGELSKFGTILASFAREGYIISNKIYLFFT
jgi:hypothetical protein